MIETAVRPVTRLFPLVPPGHVTTASPRMRDFAFHANCYFCPLQLSYERSDSGKRQTRQRPMNMTFLFVQDLKLSLETCRIYSLYHSLHHYKYHTFLHCKKEVRAPPPPPSLCAQINEAVPLIPTQSVLLCHERNGERERESSTASSIALTAF